MRKFRYQRDDFKPLPVTLEHLDICLDFIDEHVDAINVLAMSAIESVESVRLDAQGLQVQSIEWMNGSAKAGDQWREAEYDYQESENALVVNLPERVEVGGEFAIRTKTTCVPSDNILDGLYKDTTQPGCPQQYMSQCQQWGFQRIAPIIDDCRAKCTMTTYIEADARYTHLISNGNISRETNPDGKPALKPDDSSRQFIRYENPVPMAPYLFIIAVGTWDMLEDEVVYPSGKIVKLEYLVPPGRLKGAEIPMKILKNSVLWQGKTQEYEYKHDVYRTICMEKSNFGGMENVGNTTIVTSAALVDEWTGDLRLQYAHGVIVHEFEHNQCGSDVTMETPFDMWLNEAFTVDVERQFMVTQFDGTSQRLGEVDTMRSPGGGPLSIEDGGHMGNIVREGFNNPDETVDAVTYVKAAEVMNMLRLILGPDAFREAKILYFERFEGSNANTDDFFKAFEESSGQDLSQFKKEWLFTIGYPCVEAEYQYDGNERTLKFQFRQTRTGTGGCFHLPIEVALVGNDGMDLSNTARIFELKADAETFEIRDVDEPAFVSFNRDCSFYGTFIDKTSTRNQLIMQVRADPNQFNRVEAMRRLTDAERVKLIENINEDISEEWFDLYASILSDQEMTPGLKAYFLRIDESSLDRRHLPRYRRRYDARIRMLKALSGRFLDGLVEAFKAVDTYSHAVNPKDGIEERMLKRVLLRILVEADRPEVHKMAEDHFRNAWNITDRVAALAAINVSENPNRLSLLEEAYGEWKDHLNAYTSYLQIVAGGTHKDVFEMIAREQKRETFLIEHPSHNRSLFMPMASNNKMLWTDEGINWIIDTAIALASINENTVIRLLSCFQQVDNMEEELKNKVKVALQNIMDGIDSIACPSVAGRVNSYLGTKKQA